MQYYLAPMEGITGYIYRNAHRDIFGGADKYFTPFITPNQSKSLTTKEMRDLMPEHNAAGDVVPQVMTNNAEHFLWTCAKLEQQGYREVNLNLGCPSRTVVSKGRGSGFLGEPDRLDAFFEEVFAGTRLPVSVKTRIGLRTPDELPRLMAIYDRYPISELIIHPRCQADMYRGMPDTESFDAALSMTRHRVAFNGNLFDADSCAAVIGRWPRVDTLMLGRGLIANPALMRQLRGGAELRADELLRFHDRVLSEYMGVLRDPITALFRMKELWSYMSALFPDGEKHIKRIHKSNRMDDYTDRVHALLDECEIRTCSISINHPK